MYYNPKTKEKKSLSELAKQFNASIPANIEEFEGFYKLENAPYPDHGQYDHVLADTIELIDGKYVQTYKVVKEAKESKITRYKQLIRDMLNEFAQEKDYDTIESACSYANSSNETYKEEAMYAIDYRERVWEKAYELINDIKDNDTDYANDSEFMNQLPHDTWPEF